jgi:SAM-dependent methyltransferase
MTLGDRFSAQLAQPHGWVGSIVGWAMDRANADATRAAVALLDPQPGERIVDGGCGTGAALATARAAAQCHLAGFDRSAVMVARARGRLGPDAELQVASFADARLRDASFDGALLLNVLYFQRDDPEMVPRMYRALRPGGRLVAYLTHGDQMRDWPFVKAGRHELFDASKLTDTLADGGFERSRIMIHDRTIGRVRALLALAEL